VEETRPGEYFPVTEDDKGTFIFNSRDLCLVEHLPEILDAGVDSLKIEGRMKGIYYVASVVRVYRAALDAIKAEGREYRFNSLWLEELCKISHRGYTTGFLFGEPKEVGQEYDSDYMRSHIFVGVVQEVLDDGYAVLEVRNRIKAGDSLELMGPAMRNSSFKVSDMFDEKCNEIMVANPNQRVRVKIPVKAEPFDLLRIEKQ
jgi:putative protease